LNWSFVSDDSSNDCPALRGFSFRAIPQLPLRKKGTMSKPRVDFKYKRIAEDDWQIEAHYPGAEIRHIKPFKSKAEIDEWLQGLRRLEWLRSQGYAK
jgi:hypothetical protein